MLYLIKKKQVRKPFVNKLGLIAFLNCSNTKFTDDGRTDGRTDGPLSQHNIKLKCYRNAVKIQCSVSSCVSTHIRIF